MKHKLKIVGRALFCLILILAMITPSLTSLAGFKEGTENLLENGLGNKQDSSEGEGETLDTSSAKETAEIISDKIKEAKEAFSNSDTSLATGDAVGSDKASTNTNGTSTGTGQMDRGGAIIISLMEVDNSATQYQDAITAHNNSSSSVWSEMSVSITDQYLYDYPLDALESNTLSNSVVIFTQFSNGSPTSRAFGGSQGSKLANVDLKNRYGAGSTAETTSFETMDITRTAIESNDTYYGAFQNKSLDVATVRSIAEANSGELEKWKKKFISLWNVNRIGIADDILNGMFSDEEGSYYDNCLRYLDLMIIVASLSNDYDKFWEYIKDYLGELNQDGSDKFVTIAALGGFIAATAGDDKSRIVMTLPDYMALCSGRDRSLFSHIERDGSTGSPVEINSSSISYFSNKTAYINDIRSKYESLATNASSGSYATFYNKTKNIWWGTSSGVSNYALTLFPTDLNGNATGNCSYTFLAIHFNEKTIDPVKDIIEPAEDIPIESSPLGQFSIEATSDDFDVEAGTSVSAEFHIDLKLTASQRQTIRQLYQTQKTATATEVTKR